MLVSCHLEELGDVKIERRVDVLSNSLPLLTETIVVGRITAIGNCSRR